MVAGRIAMEQGIMDLRYRLRMLGIEVTEPSVMLMDNQAVVYNTTLPSSTLKKKHNSIAYHRMREAVASGIVKTAHILSTTNIADILTKALGTAAYWNLLGGLLYGRDTHGARMDQGELQLESRVSANNTREYVEMDGPIPPESYLTD
jgi:hypothetical protein